VAHGDSYNVGYRLTEEGLRLVERVSS
jgi:hypothetical protein